MTRQPKPAPADEPVLDLKTLLPDFGKPQDGWEQWGKPLTSPPQYGWTHR